MDALRPAAGAARSAYPRGSVGAIIKIAARVFTLRAEAGAVPVRIRTGSTAPAISFGTTGSQFVQVDHLPQVFHLLGEGVVVRAREHGLSLLGEFFGGRRTVPLG